MFSANVVQLYLIIICMTIIGALAAISLKLVVRLGSPKRIIFSYKFWLGGVLYLIAALLNIVVLKYLSYSVVLPLTSLTYIWTLIGGYLIFKEHIGKNQILGVLLIIVGACLIAM